MNRRDFLALTAFSAALPVLPARAAGQVHVEYTGDEYEQLLESGKPFMLDFYANW